MIKLGGEKLAPQITCYPSYGYQTERGSWLINLLGLTFQSPPWNLRQKMLLRLLGSAMKADKSELQGDTFQNRVRPFFFEADKGQKLFAEIGDQTYRLKKKSRRNGRFDCWLVLDDSVVQQFASQEGEYRRVLKFSIASGHEDSTAIACEVELVQSNGLTIVSDIDDTIKVSTVSDRRELLMNTFVRDFRSVDGMASIYRQWQAAGAMFHYVSSSPWQLFDSLEQMLGDCDFPQGTMHLRNFRLRDQFLKKVMIRRKGKASAIKRLVQNLPSHNFILIGDSGEKDPEIYQKIARRYPEQIQGIFIRDLAARPMEADRIQKLRRAIRDGSLGLFADADELQQLSEPIVERFSSRQVAV